MSRVLARMKERLRRLNETFKDFFERLFPGKRFPSSLHEVSKLKREHSRAKLQRLGASRMARAEGDVRLGEAERFLGMLERFAKHGYPHLSAFMDFKFFRDFVVPPMFSNTGTEADKTSKTFKAYQMKLTFAVRTILNNDRSFYLDFILGRNGGETVFDIAFKLGMATEDKNDDETVSFVSLEDVDLKYDNMIELPTLSEDVSDEVISLYEEADKRRDTCHSATHHANLFGMGVVEFALGFLGLEPFWLQTFVRQGFKVGRGRLAVLPDDSPSVVGHDLVYTPSLLAGVKVPVLKELCQHAGMKRSGTKAELQTRLVGTPVFQWNITLPNGNLHPCQMRWYAQDWEATGADLSYMDEGGAWKKGTLHSGKACIDIEWKGELQRKNPHSTKFFKKSFRGKIRAHRDNVIDLKEKKKRKAKAQRDLRQQKILRIARQPYEKVKEQLKAKGIKLKHDAKRCRQSMAKAMIEDEDDEYVEEEKGTATNETSRPKTRSTGPVHVGFCQNNGCHFYFSNLEEKNFHMAHCKHAFERDNRWEIESTESEVDEDNSDSEFVPSDIEIEAKPSTRPFTGGMIGGPFDGGKIEESEEEHESSRHAIGMKNRKRSCSSFCHCSQNDKDDANAFEWLRKTDETKLSAVSRRYFEACCDVSNGVWVHRKSVYPLMHGLGIKNPARSLGKLYDIGRTTSLGKMDEAVSKGLFWRKEKNRIMFRGKNA